MEVLQTSALPLGYATISTTHYNRGFPLSPDRCQWTVAWDRKSWDVSSSSGQKLKWTPSPIVYDKNWANRLSTHIVPSTLRQIDVWQVNRQNTYCTKKRLVRVCWISLKIESRCHTAGKIWALNVGSEFQAIIFWKSAWISGFRPPKACTLSL